MSGPGASPVGPPSAPGPPPPGELRLSVVLPVYQDEDRVAASVARSSAALLPVEASGGVEVIVVDDGSTDATARRAEAAGARVLRMGRNRGKGAAVRTGVMAARGRTVALLDADLAYPPGQVLDLMAAVESGWDVVAGSRLHPASRLPAGQSWLRRAASRSFNLLAAALVLGGIRDTQCGCKAWRADAARAVFGRTRLDGFAFDVEVLHVAERMGLAVTEVPVTLVEPGGSTVRVAADALRMLADLGRIRSWCRRGFYDRPPTSLREVPGLERIFKAYDVRGTVPEQLDADAARRIGAAFARFAGADRLLVAKDMRPSGVELAAAFAEGATTQGADVVDLGLCSTDEAYFAAGHLDAPAAMFTASHNPAHYNGIKMCLAGARPVGQDSGLAEVRVLAEEGLGPSGSPGSISSLDVLGDYASHIRGFVDVAALRPLRVVADTANGMGGLVVPAVFEGLPFDLEILYPELDGTFPNHPADPIQAENLRDLQDRVRESSADIGLAFDGDADRVFLVDEQARPVSGSLTTALVAQGLLAKNPGATVLHNLICSRAVPEVIEESGGKAVRTRVGHSFIKARMAQTDAIFAGEHSGHYYFRDNYRADSGLIAALLVLERLSVERASLSSLVAPLDRYAASGERNIEVDDPAAAIEALASAYADASSDRLDGLTVDQGSWWFNLRPSNTEPVVRLNLEAEDPHELETRTKEVLALVSENGGRR